MDCAEAREGLWPPERPKLVGSEVVAARTHVETCAECQEFFEQDRALLDLYDRLRDDSAPIGVRETVFDALSRERWLGMTGSNLSTGRRRLAPAVRYLVPFAAVAALGALAIGLSEPSPWTSVGADDPTMFVEDYLRRAVGQDHIQSSDPAEVVQFLQRELGIRIEPLRVEGLELVGAEICLLEGQRGAMIVYKKDGAAVSHYLVPRRGTRPRAPALSRSNNDPGAANMPVVTWSTSSVEQALVGELTSDELIRLAGARVSGE